MLRLATFFGLAVSTLLSLPASSPAWTSQFFPFNVGTGKYQEQTVNVSGTNFKLPDFSYSGYKLSQFGLGDGIPCNSVSITAIAMEDISPKLNAAVTTLAGLGGGTVYIPAGTFQIGSKVTVNADNIVIKGAGSSFTNLTVPASFPVSGTIYDGIFYFTGNASNIAQWILQSRCVTSTAVTADIALAATSIQVTNAGIFAAGDWVVVQQFFWSAFNTAVAAGTWPLPPFASQADREYSFTYVRKVVSAAGTTLVLDAPIPKPLAIANASITVYKPNANDYAENVGLEGVTLYTAPRTADSTSVYFKGVYNGWARDVKLQNFSLHGFQPQWSARITILDCAVDTAQYTGGGGQGYGYHVNASQEVLIRRCSSTNVRHNITTQKPMCSDVVFSRMDDSNSSQQDDTHHSYAHNVLWDMVYEHGGVGLSATNRGSTSSNGYETFAGGVVWDQHGDGVTGPGWQAGKIQIRPDNYLPSNQGFVIGNWGGHAVYDNSTDINSVYVNGTLMSGAGPQVGPRGNVAYEGLGTAGLQPASLFEEQLTNRAGGLPPDVAPSACGGTPTSTSTCTATGTATPTRSPTRTGTPTGTSTATGTPSATRTPSPSPSFTGSCSPTPTTSPAQSPSATRTASPSATVSPVQSSTSTLTASPSSTVSPAQSSTSSPTLSPSSTGSASPSSSPTPLGTETNTATPAETLTDSPNPTGTPTSSLTATPSPSATASATGTPVLAPLSATSSSTPSATPTPAAATATPAPSGSGALEILACLPVPNPDPLWIALNLDGSADDVELKLYSPGLTLLKQLSSGPLPSGWSKVPLPAEFLSAVPHGLCYLSVRAKRGAQRSLPASPARLYRLQ